MSIVVRGWCRRWCLLSIIVLAAGLSACAAGGGAPLIPERSNRLQMREQPGPDGPFRAHRLARCGPDIKVPAEIEKDLGLCAQFFREGSGSDGMIELEMNLSAGRHHWLTYLTLGQLYLLAGQGDPDLLPVEGPAADLGSYAQNKPRLLARARSLLARAQALRPDDAAVDYLLADVARAAGEPDRAAKLVSSGQLKCTGGRSFRILQQYQDLYEHPARYLGGPAPEFPRAAVEAGISGNVVLDLLLSPGGEIRQYVVVESPAESLTAAAMQSHRQARFEGAKIGKYAVWAWLRVTTAFTLTQ